MCVLGQERSADGGIHEKKTTITSEVYFEAIKKTVKCHSELNGSVEC
jgi:hypothetical protein